MTPYRHQSRTMLIGACIVIAVIVVVKLGAGAHLWRLPW